MDHPAHNRLVAFLWSVADDVLRDVYVRGKYRDVILPMTVIRRLDALLEPTKDAVLKQKTDLDAIGVQEQAGVLTNVANQNFYNVSAFTLGKLLNAPGQLRANFTDYLDGFSANVQEIIAKFDFRNHLRRLEENDVLGDLIVKFLDRDINLGPHPVLDGRGAVRLPGLTNHGIGYVFEELIRRFNEENNEEAGEHFTPREIVRLMANLVLLPVRDRLESGAFLVYDCACGSGGMLTEAEGVLHELAREHGKEVSIHLYGQEVQAETYAICKADLLIKGEEERNVAFGSTLSADAFPHLEFDFMLANPPYGKSWVTDLERLGGKKEITDSRFIVSHDGDPEFSLVTRSSDGQLMFLVNMLAKMKRQTALGSRIATVHNGSALFTGDAGQGESNIRRWILENDWLEAIIGLPENLFYNTGIATYIWVLSNRKAGTPRAGKVQLINASGWFTKLRKNLGKKNCALSNDQIRCIVDTFLAFAETPESKVFDNADFGYWQITVERPLRLRTDLSPVACTLFRALCEEQGETPLANLADRLAEALGPGPHDDFNAVLDAIKDDADIHGVRLTPKRLSLLRSEPLSVRDPAAREVVRKRHRNGTVHFEPDPELRDHENVPLKDDIAAYFAREVLPHVPDAWIDHEKTAKGYEISFTKYFYQYRPLRPLEAIAADLLALERETEGLLRRIVTAP